MMKSRLTYKLEGTAPRTSARAGRLRTRRGEVETPIFMPVGTQATVRGVHLEQLNKIGSRILLANTYHLLLRPGPQVFQKFGGIHEFMNWDGLVLTDSGGFQIFSLPNERTICEEGATFTSYIDGNKVNLSPESSIAMQRSINSDIMMVLDECIQATANLEESRRAMELTHRWALRSAAARGDSDQALFAIVQGACHESLRKESAEFLTGHDFDGFAIGGLAVGETRDEREHFTEFAASLLPDNKPRYLMGVGTPVDLLEAVHRGVDMFDCIIPSSLAQQGTALTEQGWVRLRRGVYKFDQGPIHPSCKCETCTRYSRAYLHHLIKAGEGLGWRLIAHHNFYFYHQLMKQFRSDIIDGTFANKYLERRIDLTRLDIDYPPHIQPPKKKRQKPRTLGAYEIIEKSSEEETYGLIRHTNSQEIMHPMTLPDLEAEHLYINQSSLRSQLEQASATPLILWDVGLGAAHNAMAAIRLILSLQNSNTLRRPVKIISFEDDLDSLRLAIKHKNLFKHLRHVAPESLLNSERYEGLEGKLIWELNQGDFFLHIDKAYEESLPDIVFYDPFSHKTNSIFWKLESFERLFKLFEQHPKGMVMVTYSASTAVRASLLAAGFNVLHGEGMAGRAATLAVSTTCKEHPIFSQAKPLGSSWLERWKRSSAAVPEHIPVNQREGFRQKILNHSQFFAQ